MALSLYEIKGTDPFSGSRLMINDNFTLIQNEINLFEDYIDLSLGTISNLTRLTSNELVIGTSKLVINSSTFELTNTLISLIGDVSINGNIITEGIDATSINSTNYPSLEYTIGSITDTPDYYIYKVSNAETSDFNIYLHAGASGQSILFVYENNAGATPIYIKNALTSTGLLYIGVNTYISLANIGDTVELKYIEDGWYITNGQGYTLA